MAKDKVAADIFISYAREDATVARRLQQGIQTGGFSVWMDTASMTGGERWTQEIESAIQSAACVVVVVSPSSNESVWVRREALYAQQLGKRIVPVLAEQVPLPAPLVDLNALALHEDFAAGVDRLLINLREEVRPAAPGSGAAREKKRPASMSVLWVFIGAGVVVVLAVIALRGEGRIAEVLATGLAIGGALLAMAWQADGAISLEFKRDLSLWLVRLDPAAVGHSVQRWPVHFAALFDRVFGKKHLSWRCFFRSCIASLLAFLLCTLIYMQAAPGDWAAFLRDTTESVAGTRGAFINLLFLAGIAAIANLLPDYVSLLETRCVIGRLQRSDSLAGQVGWLAVDVIATTAIFFLLVGVVLAALVVLSGMEWRRAAEQISDFIPKVVQWSLLAPADRPALRVYAIPVWTTFFTTAWVWLYFIAQFLMRLAIPLRRTLSFLQYALPVRERPLRAVGQVMALMAFVGYCVVMLPASTLSGGVLASHLEPEMVVIQPGSFRMGDLGGDGSADERPVRTVTIVKPFAIGKYEVTVPEYRHFARATALGLRIQGNWVLGDRPVVNVSWWEATAYANWLSEQTGRRYRLPTEAEWEYAARAGTETKYWWGNEIGRNRANCFDCGSEWDRNQSAPVGSFHPNPWGLHDTAGNVQEWVQDCRNDSYGGAPTDGTAWESGTCDQRQTRGGSWIGKPDQLRSAARSNCRAVFDDYDRYLYIGFRLAQDL